MIDINYPVYLQSLHRDLLFSPEKRVVDGVTKLVFTFSDKKNCVLNWIIETSFKR